MNGKSYDIGVVDGLEEGASTVSHESADSTVIKAQMPGKVFKVCCAVGDHVNEGDVVLVLEAMKMEIEVKSSSSGTISSLSVALGDQVASGQALASIN